MIEAKGFDVGETLVDETRAWADWLGVPHLTFFAVLGGVIERRDHHRVFETFRPGFDEAERRAREAADVSDAFGQEVFYPDALPRLSALR